MPCSPCKKACTREQSDMPRRTIAVHDEAPLQGRSWVKTMFPGRQLMLTRMQTRGSHSRGCRAGTGTVGHMSQGGLCTRSILDFCPQSFLPVCGVSTSVHVYLEGSSLSNRTTIPKAPRTMCCCRCVLHSIVQNHCSLYSLQRLRSGPYIPHRYEQ